MLLILYAISRYKMTFCTVICDTEQHSDMLVHQRKYNALHQLRAQYVIHAHGGTDQLYIHTRISFQKSAFQNAA